VDSGIKIALITAGVTFFGVIVSLIISINTSKQAARKDMVVVLQQDNDTLRRENKDLKIQIDAMEREIEELHKWVFELKAQLLELGAKPVPKKKEVKFE